MARMKPEAARPNSLLDPDKAGVVTRWHMKVAHRLIQNRQHVAERLPVRQIGVDQDLTFAVVAFDARRASGLNELGDIAR